MDLLRAVLGDKKLNYLGYSYGTFLGAIYAELYPERVGRLVLDGAIDPSISVLEVDTHPGLGFECALRAYMADCLRPDECPFRGTVDEAMADLGTLLASVDRSPLPASDGRKLGADSLHDRRSSRRCTREDSWPFLTVALTDALQGNPDVAFQLADFYYDRAGRRVPRQLHGAFPRVQLHGLSGRLDAGGRCRCAGRARGEGSDDRAVLVGPRPCSVGRIRRPASAAPIAADGAAPIVVVGTTNDPATPYSWAVSLADQLSSGVLVTRVGEGHTGFNKGNQCVDDAVEAYLLEGDGARGRTALRVAAPRPAGAGASVRERRASM